MWNDKSSGRGKKNHLPYPDETTYNKVRKHLSDFNDRITDEDIKNIRIGDTAEREVFEKGLNESLKSSPTR